jgi:hypothetical protein
VQGECEGKRLESTAARVHRQQRRRRPSGWLKARFR